MSPLLAERIATLGGLGHLPGAPGTYASLAGVALATALHLLGGFVLLALATLSVTALGWWAVSVGLAARAGSEPDPGEYVVDELAGMLLTYWPLSFALLVTGAAPLVWPWPGVLAGFILFRAFDILKPPPISSLERLPGAAGVMLDDLAAALATALLTTITAGFAHGWF